jgi:hypothetical protein
MVINLSLGLANCDAIDLSAAVENGNGKKNLEPISNGGKSTPLYKTQLWTRIFLGIILIYL